VYLFLDKRERTAATGYIFFENEILILKQTYGRDVWTYPGGFIHTREVEEIGLRREVFEETGLILGRVELIEKVKDGRKNYHVTVYRFYAEAKTRELVLDRIEVSEAKWVPIDTVKTYIQGDSYLDKAIELHKKYAQNV